MTSEINRDEQLIVRAWEDQEFKQELLSNPKAVIERELGEKFPEEVEVRMLAETANIRYLILPPANIAPEKRQEVVKLIRESETGALTELKIRSVEDNTFRQMLLNKPNTVIEHELGIDTLEGIDIRVVEEERNIRYLILPWHPELLESGELSEEALEAVAGGICWISSIHVSL
ncbi:NHLP leader peptide family RiPP precursor [Nostoc sp. FACHB-133]|uniref:NHLP leader peptide family RiPP precursor n=1 Tax=Nostoc sp. FACHB-133 TaxID=2692835 RepID=UPI001682A532|nr:NHLP leader peptide family RiPP precursor [Nostoc sp. FACHB-133]MBD2526765.1 NHLP leader peptide family natural product precursor [Nostoc sp. FACHB-133]